MWDGGDVWTFWTDAAQPGVWSFTRTRVVPEKSSEKRYSLK